MDVYAISGRTPQRLKQVRCTDEEGELQTALEGNPNLLPGDQIDPGDPRRWLIVKREMPVPDPGSGTDRWSLDFLLADQDAMPTLVECKRFGDSRARREVVGQMLDYAANGQEYWSKDRLVAMASETARRLGRELEADLRDLDPVSGATSPDSFFDRFCSKLREGEVRIIFFLEESSHDLRSIADFLNRQMIRAEVLVVEARQYKHADATIIVPVLIGYTDQIRKIKQTVTISPASEKALWTREGLIENARQSGPEVADIVERLINGLNGLGMGVRGLPTGINYGIERGPEFIALATLTSTSVWMNVVKAGWSNLNPEAFTRWKREVNHIARFYKEDGLSDPTNKGALGAHFDVLSGKVDAFVEAISDIKAQIEQAFATPR
jgi:hypothetical protein